MPEPEKPVGAEKNQVPVGGTPEEKAAPHRVFATEDDLKQYDAKRSEALNRELKKLRMEFDALKATSLTEDQQKAETQRLALEGERAKILEEADRRAGFLGVALSKGLTKEQAEKWLPLAGQEWSDPQEAFSSVAKDLGWQATNSDRKVAGGGGRNPDAPGEERFTPEYVEEMIFKHGSAWYAPRQKKIQDWQAANLPSPVRRLS
jgi:hypothetical protein